MTIPVRRALGWTSASILVSAVSLVGIGSGLSMGVAGHTGPGLTPFADMLGVSAASASDAWAVGYSDTTGLPVAVTEHWDGSAWTAVDSHAPGPNNAFQDVAALTGSDAWAVGERVRSGGASSVPLAEHWNGSRWVSVATPGPDTTYATFLSVSAVASDDVWAVGGTQSDGGSSYQPFIEHFDGTGWQLATPPDGPSRLTSVSAVSDDDIWAAGDAYVEHWDGASWSSSLPGATVSDLTALASDDVWAVGTRSLAPFAEHWDGTTWSEVAIPGGRGPRHILTSVAAFAADDVWAVGYQKFNGSLHTLTEHWDGTAWSSVRSRSAHGVNSTFDAVGGDSGADVWAVGTSNGAALAEHWNGRHWQVSPLG